MNRLATAAIVSLLSVCPIGAARGDSHSEASGEAAGNGNHLEMVWTETPPVIDGVLDEEVWQQGTLVGPLTQVIPVQGAKPSQRTEIRLLTTARSLYVGARLYDTNPEQIIANRMERDAFVFWDDRFQVTIDTFHDRQNGYIFDMNPNGSRRDVLIEGKNFQISWDTIWFARASIDEHGWYVEMEIPYQSINFDPNGDTWGINFSRGIRRNNEEDRWADPYPQRFASDVGNAGTISGMLGLEQGLGLDIVPALTVAHVDDPLVPESETRADPSGDVFYKLTPSLTATLTANTNFGETEADARQVNFSRFAIAFPEKRDFFLQDGLIFEFGELSDNAAALPLNGKPFFSRKIGIVQPDPDVNLFESQNILFGGKVTGRIGDRFKVGVLHTLVEDFEDIDKQNLGVARVAMNVQRESSLGLIGTWGDPDGRVGNGLIGADYLYRNSKFRGDNTLSGSAWFQYSFTSDEDQPQHAYGGTLRYPNDIVNWKIGYKELGEGFNPALGFVNRPGIRQYDGEFRFRTRRTGYIRTIDQKITADIFTNRDNLVETSKVRLTPLVIENDIGGNIDFNYQSTFERPLADFTIPGGVVIPAGAYYFNEGAIRASSSRNRPLSGTVTVGGGQYYEGLRLIVTPEVAWRPNEHWLFETRYDFRETDLPFGASTVHLVRGTIGIFFNADISWTTLVQWDNDSDQIGINSRFRWIYQDGRELFLVLNQGLDVEDGLRRGLTEPLIKVLWTFRF